MARALPLLLVAALLGGCASVPLGTMWKMRNASPRDFVGLEPAGLRAAVSVPDAWRLQPAGHVLELDMKLEGSAGMQARVPLEAELTLRESDDFEPIAGAHWHLLKVAPAGVDEMKRFQAFVAAIPQGSKGSFALSVTPELDLTPETKAKFQAGGKVGEISVALRLAPDQDWFLLVDGFPLKADAPAAKAKP
jgi:hypothetical protein